MIRYTELALWAWHIVKSQQMAAIVVGDGVKMPQVPLSRDNETSHHNHQAFLKAEPGSLSGSCLAQPKLLLGENSSFSSPCTSPLSSIPAGLLHATESSSSPYTNWCCRGFRKMKIFSSSGRDWKLSPQVPLLPTRSFHLSAQPHV